MVLRSYAPLQPFRLEALPAVGNHLVCGEVRIRPLCQLGRDEFGSVGRERLTDALPVFDERAGSFGIENGFER